MTVVLFAAAYIGLATVFALRLRAVRSRSAGCDELRCEFDDEMNRAVNETPKFPYFG